MFRCSIQEFQQLFTGESGRASILEEFLEKLQPLMVQL